MGNNDNTLRMVAILLRDYSRCLMAQSLSAVSILVFLVCGFLLYFFASHILVLRSANNNNVKFIKMKCLKHEKLSLQNTKEIKIHYIHNIF